MKTLLLLRHAKSDWGDPSLRDFERPLARRGKRAAPLVGAYLREEALLPDAVLCSPARRTRETWALVEEELGTEVPVELPRELYGASAEAIRDLVAEQADDLATVLVVGHNPGMEEAAHALVRGGDDRARELMARKYPTGALAVIRFPMEDWSGIYEVAGRLERFVRPTDLE